MKRLLCRIFGHRYVPTGHKGPFRLGVIARCSRCGELAVVPVREER